MKKRILIAAALSLVTTTVLADMYQDAGNAKLPEARQNLELGTVRSEGGTKPNDNNTTRFYTYGGVGGADLFGKQFEIGSRPNANEYAIEYAGLSAPGGVGVGQGATRLCWAPYSNNQVNCNYVAFGRLGQHRFANGAGFQAEMLTQGVGTVTGWPQFIASDDAIARIWAGGSADSGLELRANGNGAINFFNDIGGKLVTIDNGQGAVNDRYIRLIGGTVTSEPRIQGYSDAAPDVTLRVMGKGTGGITFENDHGTLGRFDSAGAGGTRVWLRFLGGDGTLAVIGSESPNFSDVPIYMVAQGKGGVILANQDDVDGGNNLLQLASSGHGSSSFAMTQQNTSAGIVGGFSSSGGAFNMFGFRHPIVPHTESNVSVTVPDTGRHFNNIGATVTVNFVLPQTTAPVPGSVAGTAGVHYCFHRDAAQVVRITANATDQIAFGATNSALGGTMTATGAAANFASVCLETHRQGQWIVTSTADKTQWTIP